MKVLLLFNQVNNAYTVAKRMRRRGIDASLIIAYPAPVFSLPHWEEGVVQEERIGDPIHPDLSALSAYWKMPPWVCMWHNPPSSRFGPFLASRWALRKLIQRFDVVVAHAPGALYAPFAGRPYLVYDAGWIRYLPRDRSLRGRLARYGYRRAPFILFGNPDTRNIFGELGYDAVFVPVAIDHEKFAPQPWSVARPWKSDYVILAPARQDWAEKGNHLAIQAFAQFLQNEAQSLLILSRWGRDLARSEALVHALRIEHAVRWMPPLCKPKLIQLFNQVDFVVDQFILSSWGGATAEAMACGKPVIMYFAEDPVRDCFGDVPPILNARTVEQIVRKMELMRGDSARARIGAACREWVMRHHNPDLVVDLHMRYLHALRS